MSEHILKLEVWLSVEADSLVEAEQKWWAVCDVQCRIDGRDVVTQVELVESMTVKG